MFNAIIVIKSFEKENVAIFKNQILHCTSGEKTFSPLPTSSRKFTVLRSPHVFKKSREQFEMKTYKSLITYSFSSQSQFRNTIRKIVHMDNCGVQTKIKLKFNCWFLYKKI